MRTRNESRPHRTVTPKPQWDLQHPQETLILVIVSVLDVVMTYHLLTRGDGGFVESNPFAGYFLDRWGLKGMAYFKAAMTLLVCVITQFVARHNSKLARQVLEVATFIVGLVVIYSVWLHFRHRTIPIEIDTEVAFFVVRQWA
ncbi:MULTISPECIES: DUF5658 family protein [unclassified Schlesneria]|uniref:DUF5658 family protein n=1 Tax=Schlesneria TaxID=656899 RepID=UPI0035A0C4CD